MDQPVHHRVLHVHGPSDSQRDTFDQLQRCPVVSATGEQWAYCTKMNDEWSQVEVHDLMN